MGLYKYIRDLYKQPKDNLGEVWKQRLLELRRAPATVKLSRPTRIDRARSLGYRAKQGIFIVTLPDYKYALFSSVSKRARPVYSGGSAELYCSRCSS